MEFKSNYKDVDIPENISAPEFLLKHIAKYTDRICMIDDVTGHVVTYQQFVRDCYRFAAGLYEHGLRPGDKVAVCAPNCIQYPVIFYGALLCKAVVVGFIPEWTVYESRPMYEDSSPKFIFTTSLLLQNAKDATIGCNNIQEIFLIGERDENHTTYEDILENSFELPRISFSPREDVATIIYTSGSTGKKKGIKKSHYNLVATSLVMSGLNRPLNGSSPVAVTCLSRIFSYAWSHMEHFQYGFYCGVKGIILPDLEPSTLLKAIEKYKMTYHVCTSLELLQLVRSPDLDLYIDKISSLQVFVCAGMPMLKGIPEEVFSKFKHLSHIFNLYGTSESDFLTIQDITRGEIHSGAKLQCNVVGKVVDPVSLEVVGPGQKGELLAKSPHMFLGYLNRPDANAEAFVDGWFRTGDIVYYDEKQCIFIVDRIKHMIKHGSTPVSPSEVEAVIMKHPSVSEAVVIGVPDPVYGELPRAYVVKNPGADITETQVEDLVKGYLSSFYWLYGGVQFVEDLPKTATGKILRTAVKSKYL